MRRKPQITQTKQLVAVTPVGRDLLPLGGSDWSRDRREHLRGLRSFLHVSSDSPKLTK